MSKRDSRVRRSPLTRDEHRALVFRVVQEFFTPFAGGDLMNPGRGPDTAQEIARRIGRDYGLRAVRTHIYPLIREAVELGFIRYVPPLHEALADKLAARFPLLDRECLQVVNVDRTQSHRNAVPARAAEIVMKLVRTMLTKAKPFVQLAVGPGHTTRDTLRELNLCLREDPLEKRLAFLAMTSGVPAGPPTLSPLAFFNMLDPAFIDEAESYALFSEAAVTCTEYEAVKLRIGFQRALAKRESTDIVLTGLGDPTDAHDMYRQFLQRQGEAEAGGRGSLQDLETQGWKGNVQFRPYSGTAPIAEAPATLRVPTLYELAELRELACSARDEANPRAVVLCVRPCGLCPCRHGAALLPLLSNPALKVFSHLVLDSQTAQDLLQMTAR